MIGVYAGSFDPPTLGHVDIIRQAQVLFERVVVVVASNPDKQSSLMPPAARARLITAETGADTFVAPRGMYVAAMAVDLYHDHACLVRGLRDASDMGPEIAIRRANAVIARELPTVYFVASPGVAHVSSTAVRSLIGFDGWEKVVAQYVPARVLGELLYLQQG